MNNTIPKWFQTIFVRPIFAWLLAMTLLFAGALSLVSLKQENYPDLSIPQAIISVVWPGASSNLMESKVTKELEDKLRGLAGIKSLRSASKNSVSVVIIKFRADMDMDKAMQKVRTKVDEAKSEFPDGVENPSIEQPSVNDVPVLTWMVTSQASEAKTAQLVEQLVNRLKRVSGVRKVEDAGKREKIIQIRLMPSRLQQMSISPLLIYQRLKDANQDVPIGRINHSKSSRTLTLQAQFKEYEKIRNVPLIRQQNGNVVRLKDVAIVSRTFRDLKEIVRFSTKGRPFRRAVSIGVYKRSSADTIRLVNRLKDKMKKIQKEARFSQIQTTIVHNEADIINDSIRSVSNNAWQSMVIVFLVLLVLLAWREAFIAAISIPLTFLAVLMFIYMLGYTFNQMVIIGMVLALGMLVDVFILVMEGMHEGMYQRGLNFAEAAYSTVKQYALPAFAGQSTTILAMIPLMMVGGVDGKFIRMIPTATILCLLASFVIAFLISIPLSQYMLKPNQTDEIGKMDQWVMAFSGGLKEWLFKNTVRTRFQAKMWLGVTAGLFFFAIFVAGLLPSVVYPKADGRQLGIAVSFEPGTPLSVSQKLTQRIEDVLKTQTYIESTTSYTGRNSPFMMSELTDVLSTNEGSHLIGFSSVLLPKSKRTKMGFQYIPALRAKLEKLTQPIPGTKLTLRIDSGGSKKGAPIQIVLSNAPLKQMRKISQQIQQKLRQVDGTLGVQDDLGMTQDEVILQPVRHRLMRYGLTEPQLGLYIRLLTTNTKIREIPSTDGTKDTDIYLTSLWKRFPTQVKSYPKWEQLRGIGFIAGKGVNLPLSSLVHRKEKTGLPKILHRGGKRSITVSSSLQGTQTVQKVAQAISPWLKELKKKYPSMSIRWAGESEDSKELYGSMFKALLLALFLVFVVLTLLFGSFRQPWIIFASVLIAFTGAILGMFLFGMSFSFPAMIGLVALTGIVVNNSIVMVERMNDLRKEGYDLQEAAAKGAADRIRPIISTTLTTVLGLLPLAISDPAWMPLCITIVLGLSFSTMVVPVVTPSLYYLFSSSKSEDIQSSEA